MKLLAPFALLALLALSSCASLFAQPDSILLTSDPSGVSFSTSDGQAGTTPQAVTPRERTKTFTVTFRAAGFEEAVLSSKPRVSNWAWGNVLFGLSGILFIVIDYANPQTRVFPDEVLHAELQEVTP